MLKTITNSGKIVTRVAHVKLHSNDNIKLHLLFEDTGIISYKATLSSKFSLEEVENNIADIINKTSFSFRQGVDVYFKGKYLLTIPPTF